MEDTTFCSEIRHPGVLLISSKRDIVRMKSFLFVCGAHITTAWSALHKRLLPPSLAPRDLPRSFDWTKTRSRLTGPLLDSAVGWQGLFFSSCASFVVQDMLATALGQCGVAVTHKPSVAQLTSCGGGGCKGAHMFALFRWGLEHGLTTEEAWPYTDAYRDGDPSNCTCPSSLPPVSVPPGFQVTPAFAWGNPATLRARNLMLQQLLLVGPVAAKMFAPWQIREYYEFCGRWFVEFPATDVYDERGARLAFVGAIITASHLKMCFEFDPGEYHAVLMSGWGMQARLRARCHTGASKTRGWLGGRRGFPCAAVGSQRRPHRLGKMGPRVRRQAAAPCGEARLPESGGVVPRSGREA